MFDDDDEGLVTREVPRTDIASRVAHYDAVCRVGCHHDAVIQNGAIVLVACPDCDAACRAAVAEASPALAQADPSA
jgi:hypothetical protein